MQKDTQPSQKCSENSYQTLGAADSKVEILSADFKNIFLRVCSQWGLERTKLAAAERKTAIMVTISGG